MSTDEPQEHPQDAPRDKDNADGEQGSDMSSEETPVEELTAEQAEAEAAPAETEPTASEAETPAAEEAAPAPAPVPTPDAAADDYPLVQEGMDWYVLRVASNMEDRVRDALERKVKIEKAEDHVGRILVPTQREKRMRGGAARVYHRKLYPGYVFVEMATDSDGRIPENIWFLIKETTGVGDFIGSGGKPSPMGMGEVKEMLAAALQRDETPELTNLGFKKGDKVKVKEGPFENLEGLVDEINPHKGTVRVIATIFGRETPIDIEYWQVESI